MRFLGIAQVRDTIETSKSPAREESGFPAPARGASVLL